MGISQLLWCWPFHIKLGFSLYDVLCYDDFCFMLCSVFHWCSHVLCSSIVMIFFILLIFRGSFRYWYPSYLLRFQMLSFWLWQKGGEKRHESKHIFFYSDIIFLLSLWYQLHIMHLTMIIMILCCAWNSLDWQVL